MQDTFKWLHDMGWKGSLPGDIEREVEHIEAAIRARPQPTPAEMIQQAFESTCRQTTDPPEDTIQMSSSSTSRPQDPGDEARSHTSINNADPSASSAPADSPTDNGLAADQAQLAEQRIVTDSAGG